jgi:hypothetical protein
VTEGLIRDSELLAASHWRPVSTKGIDTVGLLVLVDWLPVSTKGIDTVGLLEVPSFFLLFVFVVVARGARAVPRSSKFEKKKCFHFLREFYVET